MGSQGFRNIAGNPFVYQEDVRSAAFGLDYAAAKWKLAVSSSAGVLPTSTAQITIDPSTDGNIEIVPNGAGLLKIGSTSYPKTVAVGDVLVASASNTVGIVAGATTAGYVLTANGAGNAPSFQAAASGGITTLAGDSGTATGSTVTITGGSNLTSSATSATVTIDLDNSPTVSGTLTGLTLATSAAAANTSITGATISALGSDSNIDLTLTPKGTGSVLSTAIYSKTVGATNGLVQVDNTGILGMTNSPTVTGSIGAGTTVTAGTNLVSTAGHALLPATTYQFTAGVYKIGTYKAVHMLGGNTNIWVGDEAANSRGTGFYQSCTYNTGVGYSAMGELWNASHYNTAIGAKSLATLGDPQNSGTGSGNTCVGYSSLGTANNEVAYNTCIGYNVLNTSCTTKYSLMLGYNCGSGTSGGQGQGSSCIYLMHAGSGGEKNVIRIGTYGTGNGQQNKAFIASVYEVNPGGTQQVVLVDSNGQLGSSATIGQSYLANGLTWNAPTTSPVTAAVNNEYTILKTSGLTTINLPATAAVNTRIKIVGYGVDGWTLVAATGDYIHFGSIDSTAGGSISSTSRYDCVEVVCAVADAEWVVCESVGTLTIA